MTYTGNWYDYAGRLKATVDYGTATGVTVPDPAGWPDQAPDRQNADGWDEYLVTTYRYYPDGNLWSTTDPAGVTTCYDYDALDRRTNVVEAYSGNGLPASYANKTTEFPYNGLDKMIEKTEVIPGNDDKVYTYQYGVSGGQISSNDLLYCAAGPGGEGERVPKNWALV